MNIEKKKNIAVLLTGINQEYQNNILSGIIKCSKNVGYNISVLQCHGGLTDRVKYDNGEYNVFNLLNLDFCDGVILLTNTMKLKHFVNLVLEKVKDATIPIVSIDKDLKNAYFVGTESYSSMKNIVGHFINVHKLQKINYISGNLENNEAIQRFYAYKDCLLENNIEYEEDRVYFGNFDREDGIDGVCKFLEDSDELPEAIVCANDMMALGAYNELKKRGIKVPDQVCLSGFDNIFDAHNNDVPITTVDRSLIDVGYLALEKIVSAINGKDVEKHSLLDTYEVYTSSCGCKKVVNFKYKNQRYYYNMMIRTNLYISDSSRMSEDLIAMDSYEDIFEHLKRYIKGINCKEFYLCICDDTLTEHSELNLNNLSEFSNKYRRIGFSEKMIPIVSYKDGEFLELPIFDTSQVIPISLDNNEASKTYILSPIHFQDRCFGYSIVCNCEFALEKSIMYNTWLMNISNALENIRKQYELKIVVNKLDKLSACDGLTNVFNRHGFFKYAEKIYQSCLNEKVLMTIFYFDLDSLKSINDNYGHKGGDYAIKQLANAIFTSCKNDDICGRLGGDEFVVLGLNYTKEKAQTFCDIVVDKLDKLNAVSDKPFTVSTSYGYYISMPDEGKNLSEYISLADSKMYSNKYQKKKHFNI